MSPRPALTLVSDRSAPVAPRDDVTRPAGPDAAPASEPVLTLRQLHERRRSMARHPAFAEPSR